MTTDPAARPGVPPRWLLKALTRLHVFLHRVTGGRLFNSLGDNEVCFVNMRGAKSSRNLTVPLMYVPHRDGVMLVASQGGAPRNPSWSFNLVKSPDIVVVYRGRRMQLRARLASADEKPDLWPICDQHYAPYADFRKRTTRDIPIFVCEPTP